MTDSGSGNYTLPTGYEAVTGQTVLASQHNPPLEDIAAALNRRSFRDGRAPFTGDQNFNGYRATGAANAVNPQDYVTLSQVQSMIGLFPGFMQVDTVTSTAAPAGWLYGNGQSVSRTTYAALWARVQAGNNLASTQAGKTHGQYGPGDGSTTFTLPNVYADDGYFIRPMASGRTIGSVQADEIKAHNHTGTAQPNGSHQHGYTGSLSNSTRPNGSNSDVPSPVGPQVTGFAGEHEHTLLINNTGGTETRPKNIAYPVLIKT